MSRTETKAELKARADSESARATLNAWAARDLAWEVEPDATVKLTLRSSSGSETWTIRLYRATQPSGGYVLIKKRAPGFADLEIHGFDDYQRAVNERRALIAGDYCLIGDALDRLYAKRTELLRMGSRNCCPYHRSGGPLHKDSCGGDAYREESAP
jgi:hypothetical protein